MRKGAVVNANFVVEAIYISKLLTFQSIIFQMPSGLCLFGLFMRILSATNRMADSLSLANRSAVSKWLIDLAFLTSPPEHTLPFFSPSFTRLV